MSKKANGILGYIIQAISSRQMDMWLICDCASFSWNIYSFEQNNNDISCKGSYYIISIGKLLKGKETEKTLAHLAYPKECSLQNHEGSY